MSLIHDFDMPGFKDFTGISRLQKTIINTSNGFSADSMWLSIIDEDYSNRSFQAIYDPQEQILIVKLFVEGKIQQRQSGFVDTYDKALTVATKYRQQWLYNSIN